MQGSTFEQYTNHSDVKELLILFKNLGHFATPII